VIWPGRTHLGGKLVGGMTMESKQVIGVAGVGKMGTALVRGLSVTHAVPRTSILVSDLVPARAAEVAQRFGVGSVPRAADLAAQSDILILAAKPKDMSGLVRSIAHAVRPDSLVISLAAGLRTAYIESVLLGRGRAVRIMPNLACAVGEGATAFALGSTATPSDALVVEEIFGALGRVTQVDEEHLDAVTALSGSGPGLVAALVEAMIDGAVRSGLPREMALKLALQTMKGTAELLLVDGLEPMDLYGMVATPGGTTEAGWALMKERGVPRAISDGILAAAHRAAELAEEAAKT